MFESIFKDLLNGLKKEWETIPWTVISIVSLWLSMVAIYFLVYPRLALAAEVKPLKQNVEYMLGRQFDNDIINTYQLLCKSDNAVFFVNRLAELKRAYRDFRNQDYPELPDCQKLK